jgi:hypothetical protein
MMVELEPEAALWSDDIDETFTAEPTFVPPPVVPPPADAHPGTGSVTRMTPLSSGLHSPSVQPLAQVLLPVQLPDPLQV